MNHQLPQRMLSFKEFVAHPIYEAVKAERAFNVKYARKKSQHKSSRNPVVNTVKAVHDQHLCAMPAGSSNSGKIEIGTQMTIPERD